MQQPWVRVLQGVTPDGSSGLPIASSTAGSAAIPGAFQWPGFILESMGEKHGGIYAMAQEIPDGAGRVSLPCYLLLLLEVANSPKLSWTLQTTVRPQSSEQWRAACVLFAWDDAGVYPVLAPTLIFNTGRILGTGTGTCPGHRYQLTSASDRRIASMVVFAKQAPTPCESVQLRCLMSAGHQSPLPVLSCRQQAAFSHGVALVKFKVGASPPAGREGDVQNHFAKPKWLESSEGPLLSLPTLGLPNSI